MTARLVKGVENANFVTELGKMNIPKTAGVEVVKEQGNVPDVMVVVAGKYNMNI